MEGYSRVEHAPQIRVRGDDLKKKKLGEKKKTSYATIQTLF